MQRSCQGMLLALLLLTGMALSAHAQNSIIVPLSPIGAYHAQGPSNIVPGLATGQGPDGVALEGFQPTTWVEWNITTTTPGLYQISVQGYNNQDPSSIMAFETRPVTSPADPYVTRYATPDTKDYGQFSSDYWGLVDLGTMQDVNSVPLTVPLWNGANVFRIRNVSGRHMPAYNYPPDLTDPNNRPWGAFWSNLRIARITLTRVGDLPAFGTITGKVMGDKPAGIGVKSAYVTANPPGQSPREISQFWKNGYWTMTRDDGTYTLRAPVGSMEVMAGRPSGYELPGSTPIAVNVPATGSATANPQLRNLFKDDGFGTVSASIQNEYFDGMIGLLGVLPVDGQNGYKMGWVELEEGTTMIVDAPQSGLYRVTSSYFNGGGEGTIRVSTDLGSTARGQQPPGGWGTRRDAVYAEPIYLVQGPNAISQVLETGNSDQDGFLLTLLPDVPTVGQVKGVVTDVLTGQPVAGVTIRLGTNLITTDAQGRYSIIANQGAGQTITASHPFEDTTVTSTVDVVAGGVAEKNLNITIRPNLELTTANGFQWTALANTGGTADFSAVGASETGFVPISVPGNINTLAPEDDIYAWYRLHFTVPANFTTQLPGRMAVLRVRRLNDLAIDEVDQIWVNGTLIGQTGEFPTTPLPVQPAGHVNRPNNTVAQTLAPGTQMNYRQERNYYFPASLLKPGQDNVIAVKVFDFLGAGGIVGIPSLAIAPAVGTVSGRVIANGAGVPGVRVAASNAQGISSDWAMTDANGAFTLSHVAVGPVVIGAAKPGYLTDEKPITVAPGGTYTLIMPVATVPDGVAKLYDDFINATSWTAKWDAISEETNQLGYEPAIVAGYDVEDPLTTIPSSITIEPVIGNRGGLLSKARFSRFASVNSAKLVSALTSTPQPGGGQEVGGLPNAILQLIGPASDDPTTVTFDRYVEYDLEGYLNSGTDQRVQIIVWAAGYGNVAVVPVPFPLERLGDLSPTNPIEMTITRVGSYYDFYANGIRVYGIDLPGSIPTDHKIFLYSYSIAGRTTWDWVKVTAGPSNIVGPFAKATQALRVAGGLEAAPATGAEFTALNVATGGDSATKIDILDAVALARQGL